MSFEPLSGVSCRRRARKAAICAGALFAVVLAGCENAPEKTENASEALVSSACLVNGNCSITVPIVNGVHTSDATLVANNNLTIQDGARVVNASGTSMPVVNGGTGITLVGSHAQVGKVVSYAPTLVGLGATVSGDVVSTGNVTAAGATVTGQTLPHQALGTKGNVTWPVVYPASSGGDKDTLFSTINLAPGRFGRVHVGSHGTLQLATGAYYLDTLQVDDGAQVKLDNAQGLIVIYARNLLSVSGNITQTGDAGNLLVGYFGVLDVNVRAPDFHGSVIAQDATLHIGSLHGSVSGVFAANNIDVLPGTKVSSSTWTTTEITTARTSKIRRSPVESTAMPAPFISTA